MFRIRIHLIRIQHFRLNSEYWAESDPEPIRIELTVDQNKILYQKLQFTYYWASINVQATEEEHPALQNMKSPLYFLFLCVIFALLDTDPDSESGYGWIHWPAWIRIWIPDQKNCLKRESFSSAQPESKKAVTLPAGEYESCASLGQIQRGLEAQSHIRARDDNHLQLEKREIS